MRTSIRLQACVVVNCATRVTSTQGGDHYGEHHNSRHLPDPALRPAHWTVRGSFRTPLTFQNLMQPQNPSVTIRDVSTRSDWESAVRLRNTFFFQRPLTTDQLIEGATHHPKETRTRRTIMSVGGEDVSYGSTIENYWSTTKGRFESQCMTRSLEFYVRHLDIECEAIVSLGGTKISTWQRTIDPEMLEATVKRGFIETQRNPESALFLEKFDPEPYQQLIFRLRRQYDIMSYAEFAHLSPETWMHDAWRLEMDVMSDVPLPEPFSETPFESWVKETESSTVDTNALFIALLDGTPIAMTQLLPNTVDKTIIGTGLTGCRRDHRRRGLATGLKALSLAWAKERGFKSVWTDNEVDNPMYGLNLKLGFERQFDFVCLELTV